MAKIRDYAVTIETAAVASSVLEMPEHVTGDLLLIFFNKDTTAGLPTTPSGWSIVGTYNSAGAGNICYGKRAASSAEAVTLAYTSETSITVVMAVKNCFGSTVADAVAGTVASADDSTLALDGGTATPGYNNSLVISCLGGDATFGPSSLPGWVHIWGGDNAVDSIALSYTYQKTAASLTHPGYWAAAADDSRWIICAIRDDGNETEVDAYVDRATVPSYLVSPLVFSTVPDKGTWELTTNDITSISTNDGTKTLTQVDAVVSADAGYNPFRAATRVSSASSKTVMYAAQNRRTANDDMTVGQGILFGTWRPYLPRDYLDMGKAVKGGTALGIADASNNYQFWVIAGQFSKTTDPSNRQNYAIEVNTSDTDFARSASLPTLSAINDIYFGGSGYYGACAVEWSELFILNKAVMAGGTAANKLDFLVIEKAINGGCGNIPLMVRNGSSATFWIAVQFGGGDPVHIGCNLNVFQFPRKSDIVDYLDFHVSNNKMGFEFYGLSGDDLVFTNCVFTSDSPYYWRFNASHSASATLDFSGTTVVGATVTLQATSDLSGVGFINCPSFTQTGATLTGCEFTNTKVDSSSPANAALISASTISKTTGTNHGIEITGTAADMTLNAVTFSGYAGTNGSTGNEAIFVNIATGNMTINITGGGSTPSIRTAGATVTVQNAVNVTVTVKDAATLAAIENARVLVEKSSDGTDILTGLTNASGVITTSYAYTADTAITGTARRATVAYGTLYKPGAISGTITAAGLDVTILLNSDE